MRSNIHIRNAPLHRPGVQPPDSGAVLLPEVVECPGGCLGGRTLRERVTRVDMWGEERGVKIRGKW